jgi:hypothetical protein
VVKQLPPDLRVESGDGPNCPCCLLMLEVKRQANLAGTGPAGGGGLQADTKAGCQKGGSGDSRRCFRHPCASGQASKPGSCVALTCASTAESGSSARQKSSQCRCWQYTAAAAANPVCMPVFLQGDNLEQQAEGSTAMERFRGAPTRRQLQAPSTQLQAPTQLQAGPPRTQQVHVCLGIGGPRQCHPVLLAP